MSAKLYYNYIILLLYYYYILLLVQNSKCSNLIGKKMWINFLEQHDSSYCCKLYIKALVLINYCFCEEAFTACVLRKRGKNTSDNRIYITNKPYDVALFN